MGVDRDRPRLAGFDGTGFRCQLHHMDLAAWLYVHSAKLSNFSRTSTGVSAKPRHPPLRALEGCPRCADCRSGLQDCCPLLGHEGISFAVLDAPWYSEPHALERIGADQALF